MSYRSPSTQAAQLEETVTLSLPFREGRYDSQGNPDSNGSVYVGPVGGTTQVWAVFGQDLEPGQRGAMTIRNVPGTKVVNGGAGAWIPGSAGPWTPDLAAARGLLGLGIPYVAGPLVEAISVERGRNAMRVVARNASSSPVRVAAGISVL